MKPNTLIVKITAAFLAGLGSISWAASLRLEVDSTPPIREGALAGYAHIVQQISPSVVSITTTKNVRTPKIRQFQFMDPFSGRLFRRQQLDPNGEIVPRPQGAGSGVIISSDGYLLTNNHVVKEADGIQVAVGEEEILYDATIVGTDESTDIAVLKIEGAEFTPARLGASGSLEPGDIVLAIGSPFGLPQTVTHGIVSGVGRTNLGITGESGYEDFIQTDASINPGNSGGALIDNRGRVVGINTAIFSSSGGNLGIGFAIPSDLAVNVAEQIIEFGEVRRGFLGVNLGDLTPDLSKALNVDQEGAIVHEVAPGSPAEEAGLQSGDVVTGFNEQAVDGAARLRLMVGATRPGSEVTFQVLRDGEATEITGKIGSRDQNLKLSSQKPRSWGGAPKDQLLDGLRLSNIDAAVRARLGIPSDISGVLIEGVEPNSKAAKAGLRPGEIISEIARKPIKNLEDAMNKKASALAENSDGVILFRILSERGSRYLAVQLS